MQPVFPPLSSLLPRLCLLAPEVSIGYTARGRVGAVNSGSLEAAYTYNATGGYDGQGRVINCKVTGASVRLESKDRYHPPAVENPTHDVDGNLTQDGRWDCTWDGENRLKSMTTTSAAVAAGIPKWRLSFAYDGDSRRIRKVVENWDTMTSAWVQKSDTRFVHDGWNLLVEVEMLSTAKDAPYGASGPYVRRSYVWGPDVSETWQGAGGVGGLLVVRRHGRGTQPLESFWPTWDLNGNVIGLLATALNSGPRGTPPYKLATYECDPFGGAVRVSEPEEDLCPFRFSTKCSISSENLPGQRQGQVLGSFYKVLS